MWSSLLDLLFPRQSLRGAEGEWITPEECRLLRGAPLTLGTGALRERGIRHLDGLACCGLLDASPLLRRAIHTFKYRRIPALADTLGDLLAEASAGIGTPTDPPPTLCPVPLHWTRLFERGFNQSELLALCVGSKNRWPCRNVLWRHEATGSQVSRTREERLQAVRTAFAVRGSAPEFVVLVDDVCTTGATLDACAAALKRAGTAHVEALTLALG
jgi:ComF family protein